MIIIIIIIIISIIHLYQQHSVTKSNHILLICNPLSWFIVFPFRKVQSHQLVPRMLP